MNNAEKPRATHHEEIGKEGEDEEGCVEHHVDGLSLRIQKILPWSSRIVSVLDVDHLNRPTLHDNEDRLDRQE